MAKRYPTQSAILGAQAPAPAIQDFFSLNKVTLIYIHFQRAVVLQRTTCSRVGQALNNLFRHPSPGVFIGRAVNPVIPVFRALIPFSDPQKIALFQDQGVRIFRAMGDGDQVLHRGVVRKVCQDPVLYCICVQIFCCAFYRFSCLVLICFALGFLDLLSYPCR